MVWPGSDLASQAALIFGNYCVAAPAEHVTQMRRVSTPAARSAP